ncbi:MAG: hypothetical protein ACHQX3_09405, partial [Nitrospirales bacterium]
MTECPRISLITATPPSFNPGMLASQVAAYWFIERNGLGPNTTYYRLLPMAERLSHLKSAQRSTWLERIDDGIDYQVLSHTDQLQGTIPFYWGDLLHMKQYVDSIRGLMPQPSSSPENLLLLKDAPID